MSKPFQVKTSSVLVIGCGGAGLRAAIEAKKNAIDVSVLGKRIKFDSHTVLAAGGINAAFANLDKDDCWQQHFADTYLEGYKLGDPELIEVLSKEAKEVVLEIDSWGANFAKLKNGRLDQRFFGAHTYRRTCYSGDYTGKSILFSLLKKAESLNIDITDNQYVTKLLVSDNKCFGAISFDIDTGQKTVHYSDSTIIATGGHTRIWGQSSSRKDENTGDGLSLALEAGCLLVDMEMVQFHPTGMLFPQEVAGSLVTEAVRGEGGKLLNAKGERFMKKYDPQRMELSTRDKVAIANYVEIEKGNGTKNGGVYLDISHLDKNQIVEKLPAIYRKFIEYQMIDISKEPMEVAPTAHYSMGGILISSLDHMTSVEGLFACGEVAGGLHGGNRLGGNSLAEILVFGKRAGNAAARFSITLEKHIRDLDEVSKGIEEIDGLIKPGEEIGRQIEKEIFDTMWSKCGVMRDEKRLKEGLQKINELKLKFINVDVRNEEGCYQDLIIALNIKSSLLCAEATLMSALERKESRGAHQRSDFQILSKQYDVNFKVGKKNKNLFIKSSPIKKLKKELYDNIKNTKKITNFEGKLIE